MSVAKEIIIRRENAANTGYEDVVVQTFGNGSFQTDQDGRPFIGSGLTILASNYSGLDARTQAMQAAGGGADTIARSSISGLQATISSNQTLDNTQTSFLSGLDTRTQFIQANSGGADTVARSSISGLDARTQVMQATDLTLSNNYSGLQTQVSAIVITPGGIDFLQAQVFS